MKGWHRRRCVIPVSMLSEIIRYDPDTGHLYWKQKRRGRRMDAPAGCVTKFGDRVITFGAFTMKAQEVVWALKMSSQCFAPIRHLNGDRDDNRFENLYEDRDEDEFI